MISLKINSDYSFNFLDFIHWVTMKQVKSRATIEQLKKHPFIDNKPQADAISVREFLIYGFMKNSITPEELKEVLVNGNLRYSTNNRHHIEYLRDLIRKIKLKADLALGTYNYKY